MHKETKFELKRLAKLAPITEAAIEEDESNIYAGCKSNRSISERKGILPATYLSSKLVS